MLAVVQQHKLGGGINFMGRGEQEWDSNQKEKN